MMLVMVASQVSTVERVIEKFGDKPILNTFLSKNSLSVSKFIIRRQDCTEQIESFMFLFLSDMKVDCVRIHDISYIEHEGLIAHIWAAHN